MFYNSQEKKNVCEFPLMNWDYDYLLKLFKGILDLEV